MGPVAPSAPIQRRRLVAPLLRLDDRAPRPALAREASQGLALVHLHAGRAGRVEQARIETVAHDEAREGPAVRLPEATPVRVADLQRVHLGLDQVVDGRLDLGQRVQRKAAAAGLVARVSLLLQQQGARAAQRQPPRGAAAGGPAPHDDRVPAAVRPAACVEPSGEPAAGARRPLPPRADYLARMPRSPRCVLAVIPHPDDESYAMAGALHAAAQAGARVHVLCATRGERGDDFSARPGQAVRPSDLAARRSRELAASCAALGASAPRFLDLPDGGLTGPAARAPGGHPGRCAAGGVAAGRAGPGPGRGLRARGPFGADRSADASAGLGAGVAAGVVGGVSASAVRAAVAAHDGRRRRGAGAGRRASAGGRCRRARPEAPRIDAAIKRASIEAHRSQLPDGVAESLFPPGIVAALLHEEWYQLASGPRFPDGPAPPESAGGLLAGVT